MIAGLSNTSKLTIAHVNLNSLPNKIAHVSYLLNQHSIDICAISESWLNNTLKSSILQIYNYDLVRSDSPSQIKKHGVAVYIRSSFKYNVISCDVPNVLIIFLCGFNVYVVNVYRPPSYNGEENGALINFLNSFCNDKEVIIQGDFNLPTLRWDMNPSSFYISPLDLLFYDTFTLLGLNQVVSEATNSPSGTILDLFLTADTDRVGECVVLPPLPGCSHSPVKVDYIFQNFPRSNVDNPSSVDVERLWTKGRYDLISSCLRDVDWDMELCTLLPPDQYNRFIAILTPLIERFVPAKSTNSFSVPWPKNPPRAMVRAKSSAWHDYKCCRTTHGRNDAITTNAFCKFNLCNNVVKYFAINSQKQYELSLSVQLNVNPKLFHSYIKHKKVDKPVVGPIRLSDGSLTDNSLTMANMFVRSFASVFSVESPDHPCSHQSCGDIINELEFTSDGIREILASLNPNSSMGEDGLHPRLLKRLASDLCIPLSILFRSSLSTGMLPEQWLSSIIVPIFKKNSRYDPLNYRPISLTSATCKVFERIITKHITEYLNINSIISDQQFGFRESHSTVDQLILTYNDITGMIDEGRIVDLIFFDFSKAFDLVDHSILFVKLQTLGISGDILNWLVSFLSNRSMKVRVANTLSESLPVTSGVPQGTVVGPLLFLIYVNHIVNGLSCDFKIFADDLKIYFSYMRDDIDYLPIHLLQNNIDHLVSVCSSWGLRMNYNKCAVMRFSPKSSPLPYTGRSPYTVNNESIQFVETYCDLGVTIERDLRFHVHIRNKAASVGGLATNLLCSTLNREPEFMMNVFTMHIRPLIDYASPVWNLGYVGDLKLIEGVQRRWTKAINGFENISYSERLQRLDLFSIQGRLLRTDLILTWKILNNKCAIPHDKVFKYPHIANTRGHSKKLYLPKAKIDCRFRFFALRVINAWNQLSPHTVEAKTLSTFKKLLKIDLGPKLFEYKD